MIIHTFQNHLLSSITAQIKTVYSTKESKEEQRKIFKCEAKNLSRILDEMIKKWLVEEKKALRKIEIGKKCSFSAVVSVDSFLEMRAVINSNEIQQPADVGNSIPSFL